MRQGIKEKIIRIYDAKIASKGSDAGLSFYAFFANKNDAFELLMEVAHWWIMEMKQGNFCYWCGPLCARSGHFESHKFLNLMPIGIVYFTIQTTNSLNRAR
ncbi:hypothetical protein KW823_03740 [Enterobacter quasiroggenkampii]|nr:hypothetical protein [Enterobacter quasiroggenkampii]